MAKQTVVTLVDDLDGSEATESVPFGIDGKGYEVDLSAANAERLRGLLAPFVASARKASKRGGGPAAATRTRRATVDREQSQAIREWARGQGLTVSDRGRIPALVLEKYHAR